MIILNDPYAGGTHLPDITLVSGVFQKGTLRFYVASRAHHSDVGGMSPGSMPIAEEIYQEGLRIPPVKLVSGGVINRDVWDLILLNVRTPVNAKAIFPRCSLPTEPESADFLKLSGSMAGRPSAAASARSSTTPSA